MFLAEGQVVKVSGVPTEVRFTLHKNEMSIAGKLKNILEKEFLDIHFIVGDVCCD